MERGEVGRGLTPRQLKRWPPPLPAPRCFPAVTRFDPRGSHGQRWSLSLVIMLPLASSTTIEQ